MPEGRTMSEEIREIEEEIERTKRELCALGPIRPGTLTCQYRDPKEKKRPFWQLSYTHRMKSRSEYVRPENLATIRQETTNHKTFRKLIDQWVDLALKLSQLKSKTGAHGTETT